MRCRNCEPNFSPGIFFYINKNENAPKSKNIVEMFKKNNDC